MLGRAGVAEGSRATRARGLAEGRGIPGADDRRRSGSGPGRCRAAGIRSLRAPTEHRPGAGAREKKTTLATAGQAGHGDRTDSPEHVTRYEDLRRHVIDRGGGHRLGRALFHREGMKAWLDAWSSCTTREARPSRDACDDADRVRPLTTGDVGSVVRLVASMAMATLQDVPIVNSGQRPRDLPS